MKSRAQTAVLESDPRLSSGLQRGGRLLRRRQSAAATRSRYAQSLQAHKRQRRYFACNQDGFNL